MTTRTGYTSWCRETSTNVRILEVDGNPHWFENHRKCPGTGRKLPLFGGAPFEFQCACECHRSKAE